MFKWILTKFFSYTEKNKLNKIINKLKIFGKFSELHTDIKIRFPERVAIGSYVYIGPNAEINGLGKVNIGSGVIIGPNIFIHSANHRFKEANFIPYDQFHDFREVIIEDNVWIGANVSIAPGSHIGEGCIVAMGCVVSGVIPPLSIVAGNPCKIISQRNAIHYDLLKNKNAIYLKAKKECVIEPDYTTGFDM
jgi:acetyltransferase-like isoleucine patch superfamily enzyme